MTDVRRPTTPTQNARCVLAVDPGRAKCGIAVVTDEPVVLERAVVLTPDLLSAVQSLCARFGPIAVLVGDGTGAAAAQELLRSAGLTCPLHVVDEKHTSEAARARYIAETPARGLHRLLPRSLRTPDKPYDDFVAVILAERWWLSQRQ